MGACPGAQTHPGFVGKRENRGEPFKGEALRLKFSDDMTSIKTLQSPPELRSVSICLCLSVCLSSCLTGCLSVYLPISLSFLGREGSVPPGVLYTRIGVVCQDAPRKGEHNWNTTSAK